MKFIFNKTMIKNLSILKVQTVPLTRSANVTAATTVGQNLTSAGVTRASNISTVTTVLFPTSWSNIVNNATQFSTATKPTVEINTLSTTSLATPTIATATSTTSSNSPTTTRSTTTSSTTTSSTTASSITTRPTSALPYQLTCSEHKYLCGYVCQ